MSRGARRTPVPLQYQDLTLWPHPDTCVLSRPQLDSFIKRRTAVEMYAAGRPYDDIRQATGKVKSEVRRLLDRCVAIADDGLIFGFRALTAHTPVKGYQRSSPVLHAPGSGSGGCSGAMTQLLTRFPEVASLLHDEFFKQAHGGMPEARITITALHDKFKAALREHGLTDMDWPFNTANCGYKSLWKYCTSLRQENAQAAAPARAGLDAARRGAIGTGVLPILPALRPYGAVQLDFHKVDSASVIVLENDHGIEFEIPLPRWHFGLMVEERFGAALGYCVALELTPSGDSTLEIVSSALGIDYGSFVGAITVSAGKVLVHQLMPELAHQTFAVLKVDNGWANAAHEVVNNIIDTVGCAVNFGPTRAWWRRALIERIFGELTRRGLQRLPSTHGRGPGDTRISDPNAQAVKFRIGLPDLVQVFQRCLREHNLVASEGLQWTSPIQCLQLALAKSASGLHPQPLPRSVQTYPRLMMHVEEVTVLGSVAKNIRPYFNLDRHKHTNVKLANSPWLIGRQLVVYVDRRLARIVYASVKDTGESLGQMILSGPWAKSDCSWRDRKLMARAGMTLRYHAEGEDPLEAVRQEKVEQLAALRLLRRKKSSRTALEVAKIDIQRGRVAALAADNLPPAAPVFPTAAPQQTTAVDRFGFLSIPCMGATEKGGQ
ncbi:hypothetical protein [Collimonas humicola]|uniref:hypothetical protein n=1 Tax=Collimonas humicola TaxID=2825886 RepID=UPI001B8AEFB0|nr:hypothetical protein [Collimonas humicola]